MAIKKKVLGKGLGELIDSDLEQQIAVDAKRLRQIELAKIMPNKLQPRKNFDQSEIEALASSIKRHGILQPLILREVDQNYQIVAGERRFRAAKLAGLETLPAIVINPNEQKLYEISLIENMQRVNLNAIEEALAFDSLINEFSLKQAEVAKIVGKSRSYISNSLRLLQLDDYIQEALIAGTISSGHARALVSLEKTLQKRLLESIQNNDLSVRELERKIQQLHSKKTKSVVKNERELLFYKNYIAQLEDVLGTKIEIDINKNNSKLIINFYDDQDFQRIFDLINK